MTRLTPVSSMRNSCVLRAMRAENAVGRARASSSALVCRLCVWPCVAAIASICVRTMLLNGSCAVSDQPDVWQWVRSGSDFSDFGLNPCTIPAQSSRAARSFATSMKKFMPMAQKNESRGANWSTVMPAAIPARMYSTPSASV